VAWIDGTGHVVSPLDGVNGWMSDLKVLPAGAEARRQFVEKNFARDTDRARLAWQSHDVSAMPDETRRNAFSSVRQRRA
jgi:hypothetical protein